MLFLLIPKHIVLLRTLLLQSSFTFIYILIYCIIIPVPDAHKSQRKQLDGGGVEAIISGGMAGYGFEQIIVGGKR